MDRIAFILTIFFILFLWLIKFATVNFDSSKSKNKAVNNRKATLRDTQTASNRKDPINPETVNNSSTTRSQAQVNLQQPSTANYRPKYTQGTSSSNQSNPTSNNTSQFNSRSTAQGSTSSRNQATPTQNNFQQGTNQATPRPNATQNNTGSRQQPPQRNFQQGTNQGSSRPNATQNGSASRTQPPPQRNFQQGTNQAASRPNQPQNGSAARTQPPPKYTLGNSANSKTSNSGMQGSFGFFSGFAQEQDQEIKARRQTSQVEEVEAQRRAQEQAQREREQREREQREREQREQEQRERARREKEQREREEAQRRAAQAQTTRNTQGRTQTTSHSRTQDPYYQDKLKVLHSLTYVSSVILELTHSSNLDLMFEVLTAHANESVNDFLFASEADKDALVLYAHTVILQAKMGIINPQNEHGQLVIESLKRNHQHVNFGAMLIHLCQMACLLADDLPERERDSCIQTVSQFIAAILVASGFSAFAVLFGIKFKFAQYGFDVNLDFGESQEEKIQHACEQLGIDRNISKEEFRRIKRNKLAQYHPDKAPVGRADEYKQKFQETSALLDIVESQWK